MATCKHCAMFHKPTVCSAHTDNSVLPKVGAEVEYSFSITNGGTSVTAASTKLRVVITGVTPHTPSNIHQLRCSRIKNNPESDLPLDTEITASNLLDADETIHCSFSVTVTAGTHDVAGQLPQLTIQAHLIDTGTSATSNFGNLLTMGAVPVYSGSSLAADDGHITPSISNAQVIGTRYCFVSGSTHGWDRSPAVLRGVTHQN